MTVFFAYNTKGKFQEGFDTRLNNYLQTNTNLKNVQYEFLSPNKKFAFASSTKEQHFSNNDKFFISSWGEITSVDPKAGKAVVDGVNIAIRHQRQTQTDQGGRIPRAMPIDLSNLALLDANGKPTRVGFRMEGDKKVRFAKTTGDVIDA